MIRYRRKGTAPIIHTSICLFNSWLAFFKFFLNRRDGNRSVHLVDALVLDN